MVGRVRLGGVLAMIDITIRYEPGNPLQCAVAARALLRELVNVLGYVDEYDAAGEPTALSRITGQHMAFVKSMHTVLDTQLKERGA